MDYQNINYVKKGKVATIILNRPERMNAYTQQLVNEMVAAIEDVRLDDNIKVLVITGSGRSFCSGWDVTEGFPAPPEKKHPLYWFKEMREGFHRLILTLRGLDKPLIASINGPAVAGGLALALLCDVRIASERAKLGDGSLRFGFLPDDGATYLLPRIMGANKALEFILLGEIVDANKAKQMGLVSKVVPHEELETVTEELANRIAAGPSVAQQLVKRAIYRELDMDLASSLEDIAILGQIVDETEDAAEGVRAFKEKRQPIFKGR